MTGSRQPQINEELLSAYLDDEVTDEERVLVETAMAADPAVAWQVESLRQTIHFLQTLPPLALPRTFTLEAVVADVQSTKAVTAPQAEPHQPRVTGARLGGLGRTTISPQVTDDRQSNWWQWLLQIWHGGNLQLRNAAAVAFTILIVLLVSDRFVLPTQLRQPTAAPGSSAKLVTTGASKAATGTVIVMTAAPVATAVDLAAPTAPTASVTNAPQAGEAVATSAQSAKIESEQNGPLANQSTAKMLPAPSGPPGEDIEDISGAHQGGFSDQTGQGESMSATMTNDGRTMATASSGAALTAPDVAPAPARALAITATVTVTPTPTVTATEVISVAAQTGMVSHTEITAVSTGASDSTQATPTTAPPQWLVWAEIMAGVCTIVLAGLWWRSRGFAHA